MLLNYHLGSPKDIHSIRKSLWPFQDLSQLVLFVYFKSLLFPCLSQYWNLELNRSKQDLQRSVRSLITSGILQSINWVQFGKHTFSFEIFAIVLECRVLLHIGKSCVNENVTYTCTIHSFLWISCSTWKNLRILQFNLCRVTLMCGISLVLGLSTVRGCKGLKTLNVKNWQSVPNQKFEYKSVVNVIIGDVFFPVYLGKRFSNVFVMLFTRCSLFYRL